jgi:hypothetical protein
MLIRLEQDRKSERKRERERERERERIFKDGERKRLERKRALFLHTGRYS